MAYGYGRPLYVTPGMTEEDSQRAAIVAALLEAEARRGAVPATGTPGSLNNPYLGDAPPSDPESDPGDTQDAGSIGLSPGGGFFGGPGVTGYGAPTGDPGPTGSLLGMGGPGVVAGGLQAGPSAGFPSAAPSQEIAGGKSDFGVSISSGKSGLTAQSDPDSPGFTVADPSQTDLSSNPAISNEQALAPSGKVTDPSQEETSTAEQGGKGGKGGSSTGKGGKSSTSELSPAEMAMALNAIDQAMGGINAAGSMMGGGNMGGGPAASGLSAVGLGLDASGAMGLQGGLTGMGFEGGAAMSGFGGLMGEGMSSGPTGLTGLGGLSASDAAAVGYSAGLNDAAAGLFGGGPDISGGPDIGGGPDAGPGSGGDVGGGDASGPGGDSGGGSGPGGAGAAGTGGSGEGGIGGGEGGY